MAVELIRRHRAGRMGAGIEIKVEDET